MENLRINQGVKPKRKPNLVRWFNKHKVSGNIMSVDSAIPLAIEHVSRLSTILIFFCLTITNAQIHLSAGVTDIAKRLDGNTLNWDVDYTHTLGSVGLRASYGKVMVKGLNYDNVEASAIYRVDQKNYRLDLSFGGSWNDVDYKIDPMAGERNSFKIDKGLFVFIDYKQVFKSQGISHFSAGFALSVDWRKQPRRSKRFF